MTSRKDVTREPKLSGLFFPFFPLCSYSGFLSEVTAGFEMSIKSFLYLVLRERCFRLSGTGCDLSDWGLDPVELLMDVIMWLVVNTKFVAAA
jgi:hypothetical protein